MDIQKSISLKPFNTFQIDEKAHTLVIINSVDELQSALKAYTNPLVIGCGSNLLITKTLEMPVFKMNLKGIRIQNENENFVCVEAMAGEHWQALINFCLKRNLGGLENLSLIPSSVGAAPVQNIGAYGVEVKDVMLYCKALNMNTLQEETFTVEQCEFGYRESVFKQRLKGQYVITAVCFKLTKKNHQLRTSYGNIQTELTEKGISNPTPFDVSQAVIRIREQKIPNPTQIGSGGSFFKNPIVSKELFEHLVQKNPSMPHYVVGNEKVKIPAGWLIEQAGFKGYRKGDAGVYEHQALILVNYGNATGAEILQLSQNINQKVYSLFGICLETEVNIL